MIELLGIHRLPLTPELIAAQVEHFSHDWVAQHPEEARRAAIEELDGTVLVEVQTHGRDGRLRVDDFTQRLDLPVRTPTFTVWRASGELRVAFYLHLWDPSRPLETSYGPVSCPRPSAMPERLWRLLPYVTVD